MAHFEFDYETLRFEIARSGGYIGQGVGEVFRREYPGEDNINNPDNPDDLVFEIGKCNPL
jgi:hypothetical protein